MLCFSGVQSSTSDLVKEEVWSNLSAQECSGLGYVSKSRRNELSLTSGAAIFWSNYSVLRYHPHEFTLLRCVNS